MEMRTWLSFYPGIGIGNGNIFTSVCVNISALAATLRVLIDYLKTVTATGSLRSLQSLLLVWLISPHLTAN